MASLANPRAESASSDPPTRIGDWQRAGRADRGRLDRRRRVRAVRPVRRPGRARDRASRVVAVPIPPLAGGGRASRRAEPGLGHAASARRAARRRRVVQRPAVAAALWRAGESVGVLHARRAAAAQAPRSCRRSRPRPTDAPPARGVDRCGGRRRGGQPPAGDAVSRNRSSETSSCSSADPVSLIPALILAIAERFDGGSGLPRHDAPLADAQPRRPRRARGAGDLLRRGAHGSRLHRFAAAGDGCRRDRRTDRRSDRPAHADTDLPDLRPCRLRRPALLRRGLPAGVNCSRQQKSLLCDS